MHVLATECHEVLIGDIRDTSQPTISRYLAALVPLVKSVLEEFVPSAADAIEVVKGRVVPVDGTLTPCWSYEEHQELWNKKHKTTGFNAQLISLLDGSAVWISGPLPGKTHDAKAFRETGAADIVKESGGGFGDKGYQGVHSSLKERAGVKRVSACGFAVAEVFEGMRKWPRGSPFLRAGARVRASGLAGSRTGRSRPPGGGAGGVLDAGAREPMIEACGEGPPLFRVRVYAVVVAPRPLRPGSLLAAFIPSFVPGCPRGAWGGFAPGRAGSITGAPAPPWSGGQNGRRPRARPQARTGHAACPRWRARRTCPSRIP